MVGQSGYGSRDSQQAGGSQTNVSASQMARREQQPHSNRPESGKALGGSRLPSNRDEPMDTVQRKSGTHQSTKGLMYSMNSNSQSQKYMQSNSAIQPMSNIAGGTPVRGQSGSNRRKIVAQQSQ